MGDQDGFKATGVRETGELVTELTAKAGEAERAGVSRRSFVTSALLATGATVLGSAAVARAAGRPVFSKSTGARSCSCSEKRIFSIAATAELLATTMYYRALALPTDLPDVNSNRQPQLLPGGADGGISALRTAYRSGR
jgi:hypothetical protein